MVDRRLRVTVIGPVPDEILSYLSALGEATVAESWNSILSRNDLFVSSASGLRQAIIPSDLRKCPMIIIGGQEDTGDGLIDTFENSILLTLPVTQKELTLAVRSQLRVAELQNALTREEQLFAKSQRRLGMALKAASMGSWTRDLRTERLEWSPELEEIYGLVPGTFAGTLQASLDLMHPDDRDEVARAVAKATRRKKEYEVEYRYRHASGEYRWMAERGRGFYDASGNLVELAGVGIDITEKKRSDQRLRERESQLRQIGDNLPDGALYQIIRDTAGKRSFVYWSAGLERLTGVAVEEALRDPRCIYELVHPDDISHVRAADEKSFRERSMFDVIARVRHRITGEWHWVHLRSAPRSLPDGSIVWDGIYADVTERKRVEEALAQSVERLALAQRVGHIGVFDWHIPSGAVVWSEEEQRIYGLIPGTFEGNIEGWRKRTVPEDLEPTQKAIEAAMERGDQEITFGFRIVHASGSIRWIEGAARFFYDDAGNPLRMVGVNFDVTEREEFQQQLKEVNQELQRRVTELETVTNVLPIGLAIAHDPECRMVTANRSFAELAGLARGVNPSMSGPGADKLPYRVYRDGREVPSTELPMQRAAAHGILVRSEEYELRMQDGRIINLLINAGPLLDEQGKSRGAVGAHIDITAAKMAERFLRDADRRKNEFLAMLSHELRNPLAAIRNALAVCNPTNFDPDTFAWASGVLARQSTQLARLVDDLLDVARITRGKIQLRKTRVDASTVLDRAVESVRSAFTERNQEFITAYDTAGPLMLEADPARLEQIIVNLLTNANKYTEPGGRVWLQARRKSAEIVISVRDSGIGIQPEKLPEMFEIFAQGERSIDRSEGGLGLGLSIVRSLTEMHGGTVTACSEGLGKGTEFIITLPAVEHFVSPIPVTQALTADHHEHKARVLVVDDNVDTAHGMARLLRRRGYTVETAYDGPSALQSATTFEPSIMLLDLGLPGMDGFELAARLRTDNRFKEALMIAVSGYGQEEDRIRSKAVGFNYHLVKPVDLQELQELLRQPVGNQ